MLFRKKIEKSCAYCNNGTVISGEQVLCTKKGVVSVCGKCRKFKYDPCKRIPTKAKALNFAQYNEIDYSL